MRRSVVLPAPLIQSARAAAPHRLRDNLNGLVKTALLEYARRHKERSLEEAMARMARDPALRAECAAIAGVFMASEKDGLGG